MISYFFSFIFSYVQAYGFCIACSIICSFLLLCSLERKYGVFWFSCNDCALLFQSIYISGLIGSRLLYVLYDDPLPFVLWWRVYDGGLSVFGAILGAIIPFLYYAYGKHITYFSLFTVFPIFSLLVHAGGRLGCFFAGCCDGVLWCMSISLVSCVWFLLVFFMGLWRILSMIGRNKQSYEGIYLYCIAIGFERGIMDFARSDHIFCSFHQLLGLFFLLIGIMGYIRYTMINYN